MRQYIGARYVAKIYENSLDHTSSEWEANVNYEALVIVTYNNGSYMSKKVVPANIGNPAANPTYWTQTGFYNGQIAALNNRITAAEDTIDRLNRQNILLISDSYGDPSVSGGTSWEEFVETAFPDKTITSEYKGGGGFGYDSSDIRYFPSWFSTFQADDTVDMIFILCGANDGNILFLNMGDESDIRAGLTAGMTTLKSKFPNAEIHMGFVGRYKDCQRFPSYKQARNVYIQGCRENGIIFANNFEYVLHDISLIGQGDIHPTLAGSTKISKYAIDYIKTGHIDVIESGTTVDEASDLPSGFGFDFNMYNGVFSVTPNVNGGNSLAMSINQSVAANISNFTLTFDFEADNFNPYVITNSPIPCSMVYNDGSDHPFINTGTMFFSNKKMYIFNYKRYGYDGGTYNYLSAALPSLTYDSMDC